MSIWDDKDVIATGDYIRFENVGDSVEGVVSEIVKHTFVDDETGERRVAPKLTIICTDGVERILTAGQVRLRLKLVELRPEVSDYLKITLTENEKRGKKTLKHFDVTHKKGDGSVPKAAASAHHATDKPPF